MYKKVKATSYSERREYITTTNKRASFELGRGPSWLNQIYSRLKQRQCVCRAFVGQWNQSWQPESGNVPHLDGVFVSQKHEHVEIAERKLIHLQRTLSPPKAKAGVQQMAAINATHGNLDFTPHPCALFSGQTSLSSSHHIGLQTIASSRSLHRSQPPRKGRKGWTKMESAIMVLVVKEKKKEGDPIKRYTVTLPLLSPLFFCCWREQRAMYCWHEYNIC